MWEQVTLLIFGTIFAGGTGWFAIKFRKHLELPAKVDRIEADVHYLRTRVDSVYDHLVKRDS